MWKKHKILVAGMFTLSLCDYEMNTIFLPGEVRDLIMSFFFFQNRLIKLVEITKLVALLRALTVSPKSVCRSVQPLPHEIKFGHGPDLKWFLEKNTFPAELCFANDCQP